MLRGVAESSGMETPSNEDSSRMDRKRAGKELSNKNWESPTDSDARIARMKDGASGWPTSRSTQWTWIPGP